MLIRLNLAISLAGALLISLACCHPCQGQARNRQGNPAVPEISLARRLKLPVTVWSPPGSDPSAIVVAVHGLVMHGGTFDVLARSLAAQGFLVAAPDLRGYGRWMQGSAGLPADTKVDYKASQKDLLTLLATLKNDHPGLPVFCLGESLGADEVIRAAAARPELISGLVLSSPGIKHRAYFSRQAIADMALFFTNPKRQLDMRPFIKSWASEDAKIIKGMLDDPLVRKHLSTVDLLKSRSFLHSTIKFVKALSPDMPVLIIQGDGDRILKSNAVVLLLKRLKSKDQIVRWFHGRGHILVETAYIQSDTLETVKGWLTQHAAMYDDRDMRAARSEDTVAAESP